MSSAHLVYMELLVTLYLVAKDLTFDGQRSCVLQHLSNLTSGPKSKNDVARSPLPHHFVPTKHTSGRFLNASIFWEFNRIIVFTRRTIRYEIRKISWWFFSNISSFVQLSIDYYRLPYWNGKCTRPVSVE